MDASFTLRKAFVSENTIEEAKKRRQEEWKKTHEGEEPPPEEDNNSIPYDPRPLAEQLADQKRKKDEEFREKTAFKNQLKRLDEDELEFLKNVEKTKSSQEEEKQKEEMDALNVFRQLQSDLVTDYAGIGMTAVVVGETNKNNNNHSKNNSGNSNTIAGATTKIIERPDFQKKVLSGLVVTKKRKSNQVNSKENGEKDQEERDVKKVKNSGKDNTTSLVTAVQPTKPLTGLVAYGTDDEEEDKD